MESKLRHLLEDLYTLEPSLRERESELVPMLDALLQAKPDTTLDAHFAANLRHRLLTPSSPVTLSQPVMKTSLFNKFAFAGLGSLAAIIVAVPLTYELTRQGASWEEFSLADVSSSPVINSMADDAFGSLTITSEATINNQATPSTLAAGSGGGNGNAATNAVIPEPMADGAEDVASSDSSKMVSDDALIYPYPGEYYQYTYRYEGEALNLADVSDAVYRKNGGLHIGNLGNDLTRAKLGPVDIGAFKGMELQSFNLKQDDKNGYTLYVDPYNGMISISGNEGIWGYTNGEYVPFREEQIMSDADLIATADAFLKDYDIDLTGFGAPVVDTRSLMYARSQPVEYRYFPEVMNVTYPLLLEGQPTYSEDGSPFGLYVNVNMRTKVVSGVSLNVASSYDKSSYALERDSDAILKLAEQGGLYNYPMEGATNIELTLGTPEVILINHYNYNGTEGETLFIPALSFPITSNSEEHPVYTDRIVIPLVQSVIDKAAEQPSIQPFEGAVMKEAR